MRKHELRKKIFMRYQKINACTYRSFLDYMNNKHTGQAELVSSTVAAGGERERDIHLGVEYDVSEYL
jgi:hypothetical protein